MKKRMLSFVIVLALVFTAIPLVNAGDIIGAAPTGTENDPFLIDSVFDLYDFFESADNSTNEKVYFALVNDIWAASGYNKLSGYVANNISLDGNGHALVGFKVTGSVFESVEDSYIRNITFENITVSASEDDSRVCVIAKEADDKTFITSCTFRSCTVNLPLSAETGYAAMAVADSEATITNTVVEASSKFVQSSTSESDARYDIGGIVTNNTGYGYVVNSIVKPTLELSEGPYYRVGGAAAYSESNVAYCYSDIVCPEYVSEFDAHVCEQDGQYAGEDYWIKKEDGGYTVLGGENKSYSEMSLLELSAELSECVFNNYNEKSFKYLGIADLAVLWSVENDDLFFSYDGKTGSVYFYLQDAPLKGATVAFSDSGNSEELSENEKYAIRVGSYDENGTYTRNSFEISLYTKDFKMVESYVYRPNQKYVKSLINTMDDTGVTKVTYSDMYLNSTNNGADYPIAEDVLTTGIINKAAGEAYPFCTTVSLTNISSCDELVYYRFEGEGTEEIPFEIHNFYELECLAHHVNMGKTYFDGLRYNEAYYKVSNSFSYPYDRSVIHTPIGSYSSDMSTAFKGSFDGQGATVRNLTVRSTSSYQGLFGIVSGKETAYGYVNASLKNICIEDMVVEDELKDAPGDIKGCLAGQISHTTVNGCAVDSDSTVSGGTQLGGIIGYANNSEIFNCGSAAKINTYHPNAWAGGIVGYSQYCTVKNCYAGNLFTNNNVVDAETLFIGGIAGRIKKSEFDHTFYRFDNSADGSLITDGIETIGLSNIQTEDFAARLTYYSERNGLGVTWTHSEYNFNKFPYISDQSSSNYLILCMATNYGSVTALDTNFDEVSSIKGGETVRVEITDGLQGIRITDYRNNPLGVTVKTVSYGSDFFEFTMPYCAIRIIPDYGKAALVGYGTEEVPYMLSSYEDLVLMSELINSNTAPKMDGCDPYLNAHYILTQDIDCGKKEMNAVANTANGSQSIRFGGDFDGRGYTISNLSIVSGNPNDSYPVVAFFSYTQGATVHDVRFENVDVNGNYASVIVGHSYGYLGVSNVEIVGCTLNGDSYASAVAAQSYATCVVNNCIVDSVTYNAPSSAYILRECDEYVSFAMKNCLILNMQGERSIVEYSWSTSKVSVDKVYHCNAPLAASAKYTATEISADDLSDAEFISTLTGCAVNELGLSTWGIRKTDSRASLSVLDDTVVCSPITYDSIFTSSQYKLLDMATAPTYACEGDMVEIKYGLRYSTANIKAEVGNRTVKCVFDGLDSGNGYGTVTFNMPSNAVHITNNDQPIAVKHLLGKGTSDDPYIIETPDDLCLYADYVNDVKAPYLPDESFVSYESANVSLAADIDMTGIDWDGIGSNNTPFNGTFDGYGHCISNLNAENGREDGNRQGLFHVIGKSGTVTRLKMSGADVYPSEKYGEGAGTVTKINNGTISQVFVESCKVTLGAEWDNLGGIAGLNGDGALIINCGIANSTIRRPPAVSFNVSAAGICETNRGEVQGCMSYNCTLEIYSAQNAALVARGNDPENSYYYTKSIVNDDASFSYRQSEFNSGCVTFCLNGGASDSSTVWRQTLGTDNYPVLDTDHKIVYHDIYESRYTNLPNMVCMSSPVILRGNVVIGDVNLDNVVDENDALEMESFFAGKSAMNYFSIIACDVNGDGKVDENDYDAIIAHLENNNITGETLIGKYKSVIDSLPEGTVVIGDVNRDGTVDKKDIEIIKKYISGELKLTDEQRIALNTALRDKIDSLDLEAVREFLANIADLRNYSGNVGKFMYAKAPARYYEKSTKPQSPETGDRIIWISFLMLSSLGIAATAGYNRHKKKKEE